MPTRDLYGLEEEKPENTLKKGLNYLLAIGIDQYQHCPPLYNATKDAKEVVSILKDRYLFEEAQIKTLYNEQANRKNIYSAFRSLAETVTSVDNVVIYFSGHGIYDNIYEEGYWIPVEADKDDFEHFVPNSDIRKILSAIKSRHTFVIVDSCFSGTLFGEGAYRNITFRKERDPSRWGLTAGRKEVVADGEKGKNSPFARSLIKELKNADRPLGVAELCNKILEIVPANAEQTPRGEPLKVKGHEGGQMVFHLRKNEAADWAKAKATNTVQAFETFLMAHPSSKKATEAQHIISTLKESKAWLRVEALPEETAEQVQSKLIGIHHFISNFPNASSIREAEHMGELLGYKKEFLTLQNNLFGLKRFSRKTTPFQEAAQLRIQELEKAISIEKDYLDQEKKAKETAKRQSEEKRKREAADREREAQEKAAKEQLAAQEKAAAEKRKAEALQQKRKKEETTTKGSCIKTTKREGKEEKRENHCYSSKIKIYNSFGIASSFNLGHLFLGF